MAIDAGFTITVWEESRGKSPLPPPPPNPSLTFSVIMRYPDFGPLLKNYMASAELGLVVPAVEREPHRREYVTDGEVVLLRVTPRDGDVARRVA